MSLQIACKLLDGIEALEKEEKEKGFVTKTFLRKILELVDKAESKEDYILSVAYMVARNRKGSNDDLTRFFNRLKDVVDKLKDDWKKDLKRILQNVVKLYYVKAANVLEEDLICTTK